MCDRSMDAWGIELLLSTVNGVAVPAQEESYPVADKVWKKCWEPLLTISEMCWREIKTGVSAADPPAPHLAPVTMVRW